MTDNPTGPELLWSSIEAAREMSEVPYGSAEGRYARDRAIVTGLHALAAALVMSVENHHEYPPFEVEAWREVIPLPPLKECKGKEIRRPACEERHTDDCQYADPPQEPKHVLLDVGTRVLVSKRYWKEGWYRDEDPVAGRISGYDMHKSKYRWQQEWEPGRYASHDSWAFVGNHVEVHPEGPECPSSEEP